MAKLQQSTTLRAKFEGLDNAKTMMEVLATKANRLQHLFNEIYAGLIDLENEMNNLSITLEIVAEDKPDDQNNQPQSSREQGLSSLATKEEAVAGKAEKLPEPAREQLYKSDLPTETIRSSEELHTREAP